jgi:MSHA pilin protein MshA
MKSSNQKGFTLIELVIVIVILGILAVTAAPKFLNIQGDARGATVAGMEGALKGGISIIYSKALIQNKLSADSALTDPAVDVKFGYPDATLTALQEVLDTTLAVAASADPATGVEWEVFVDTTTTPDSAKIYPAGDYDGDPTATTAIAALDCYVLYTEATDADTPASVSSVTTGC